MSDGYIRKQDAVSRMSELLVSELHMARCPTWNEVYNAIGELPSADVAPVRHGRWLPIVSYNNTYKCSECGRLLVDITDGLKMVAKHYPYCHCGAKMDGERKK